MSARVSPSQLPGSVRTGSARVLRQAGSGASLGVPPQRSFDHTGTRVHTVALAHGGRGVTEAETHGLGQRNGAVAAALPEPHPEAAGELPDVAVAVRGEAGGAGADPQVPAAPRRQQVVVEGRDPVHGRLGEAGHLRRP